MLCISRQLQLPLRRFLGIGSTNIIQFNDNISLGHRRIYLTTPYCHLENINNDALLADHNIKYLPIYYQYTLPKYETTLSTRALSKEIDNQNTPGIYKYRQLADLDDIDKQSQHNITHIAYDAAFDFILSGRDCNSVRILDFLENLVHVSLMNETISKNKILNILKKYKHRSHLVELIYDYAISNTFNQTLPDTQIKINLKLLQKMQHIVIDKIYGLKNFNYIYELCMLNKNILSLIKILKFFKLN